MLFRSDGWYATGDVGFIDPSGDLFLVDRVKELVIVSGFNVYPTEVEDVLREVAGVTEAAVVGVPHGVKGEMPVAAVVRAPDGFRVTATAPDGVVEAIEDPSQPFCLGVQWHPENFWRTGEFRPLFEGFVEAARKSHR